MSSALPSFEAFRTECRLLLEQAQHIVITAHVSPDDDSIGSVLALHAALTEQFPDKTIRIVYTGTVVSRYQVFERFSTIEWVPDIADHLEGVDVLFTADASNWHRFSKKPEALLMVPVRIGVDHHASTPDSYTLLLKDESYSSCTQLIFDIFYSEKNCPEEVAHFILLGLVGDTGTFSYVSPAQTNSFLLGKFLVEKVGMSIDQFRSRYSAIPQRIIPLLQELVAHTTYTTIEGWPPFQYSFIDRQTMEKGSYSDEDMSAASHIYMGQYLTRVEGYRWGFVVTPRNDGGCRQSARSLPESVNVRDFHERLGIGSGHNRAAGGSVVESEPTVWRDHVLLWMRDNMGLIE